jgi:hypothetical protein
MKKFVGVLAIVSLLIAATNAYADSNNSGIKPHTVEPIDNDSKKRQQEIENERIREHYITESRRH